MGTKEHKKSAPKKVKVGIISVSTTRALKDDKSGHWISKRAKKKGYAVVLHRVIPDKTETITQTIYDSIEQHDVQVLLLTGGTGISGKDVTIEAVRPLFDKELTAFGPLFYHLSLQEIEIGRAHV